MKILYKLHHKPDILQKPDPSGLIDFSKLVDSDS